MYEDFLGESLYYSLWNTTTINYSDVSYIAGFKEF